MVAHRPRRTASFYSDRVATRLSRLPADQEETTLRSSHAEIAYAWRCCAPLRRRGGQAASAPGSAWFVGTRAAHPPRALRPPSSVSVDGDLPSGQRSFVALTRPVLPRRRREQAAGSGFSSRRRNDVGAARPRRLCGLSSSARARRPRRCTSRQRFAGVHHVVAQALVEPRRCDCGFGGAPRSCAGSAYPRRRRSADQRTLFEAIEPTIRSPRADRRRRLWPMTPAARVPRRLRWPACMYASAEA